MPRKPRNYRKEYDEYHAKPEQKKRRAERNRDRNAAEKKGLVRKGDGKELDHMGSHRKGNLKGVPTKIVSKHANRIRQPKRGRG